MQKNGCVKVGKYHIRMMNEIDKKAICNWKYTGVYEVYNLPNYECLKKECVGFTNPKRICDYYVVEDDRNGLVAFFGLIEEDDEIFIGLGVHPNYCSKGIGTWVLEEAIKIKKRRYGRKKLYLEVRTWNVSA